MASPDTNNGGLAGGRTGTSPTDGRPPTPYPELRHQRAASEEIGGIS